MEDTRESLNLPLDIAESIIYCDYAGDEFVTVLDELCYIKTPFAFRELVIKCISSGKYFTCCYTVSMDASSKTFDFIDQFDGVSVVVLVEVFPKRVEKVVYV